MILKKSAPKLLPRQLVWKAFEKKLLKRNPETVASAYKYYEELHDESEVPGNPISKATFHRWWKYDVSEYEKILAQRGKKAAREFVRTNLGRTQYTGFQMSTQLDALWDPIKLRCHLTFLPLSHSPIHHFAIETDSTVISGFASNYITGTERVEYVIDGLKIAMLPKIDVQETWGTTCKWPIYGKTFEWVIDAGSAYNNTDLDTFSTLAYTSTKVTRSRSPYEKAFVESFNNIFKHDFTSTLPGSYDDKLPKDEQEKVTPVLTELEHSVLMHRYIIDEYNQGINNYASHGLSRTDYWRQQAGIQSPALPRDSGKIVNYLGASQSKAISDKKGIRITVQGKAYTYNSNELQTLRNQIIANIKDPAKQKVALNWSISQPDHIVVRIPGTNDVMKVDRVSEDRGNTDIIRRRPFDLDPFYYEMQDLDILSKMSTEEIKQHALQRQRAINQATRSKRRNSARRSVSLDLAIERDAQRFAAIISPSEPTQNQFSEEFHSEPVGFMPGNAEDLDWGQAFGGDNDY